MAAKERAIHLDYFDPAVGKVPNPGMGVQGYVYRALFSKIKEMQQSL